MKQNGFMSPSGDLVKEKSVCKYIQSQLSDAVNKRKKQRLKYRLFCFVVIIEPAKFYG